MLRPGERNRLEEGINYFPAGAPRRTLFFTLDIRPSARFRPPRAISDMSLDSRPRCPSF